MPHEAISVKEALRLYTVNAAYAGYEENIKGVIAPGMLADLVVIDKDILSVPEDEIKNIKVDMTIINGEIVYTR